MSSVQPNAVVDHLLVQKALVDEDPAKLEEYVRMAEADVTTFRDPFDRAIALTFHLVLDEHLDPWDIDLLRFSKLYADRVSRTHEVDLTTAGRLISMAWTILRRQSEGLLARATPPAPPEPAWDVPWDAVDPAWNGDDEASHFTQRVLASPRAPLVESIFHQGDRRVTLIELVEALEEARRDAEVRIRLTEERRKARELALLERDLSVRQKVHKEDLEAEIAEVRRRLLRVPDEVTFAALHDGSRDDFLTAFVSCLFLSRASMVDLRQEQFPTGPILVEPLPALHDPNAPLIGLPTKQRAGPATGKDQEEVNDDEPDGTPRERNPIHPDPGPAA